MDCPRCHKTIEIAPEDKEKETVKCQRCGRDAINEDAQEGAGVRKVETIDSTNTKIFAYESIGDTWKKFPSWYCLKVFETLDDRLIHDKLYHKKGDPQMGMIPSGNPIDFVVTCDGCPCEWCDGV